MDQRKGDARVYVVSGLFFSCIISGGVFLCLYIVLPETQSSGWFPIAGLVLVSIPWAFWLFTFLYRCFKFHATPPQLDSSNRFSKGGGSTREPATAAAPTTPNTSASDSPAMQSPCGGAERRVQFGPVVVLGGEGEGHAGAAEKEQRCDEQEADHEISNCSRESEMPLRLSV
ncbi:hypothetical protein TorRG33x02_166790 [Trema orientale]|uniref:Transmembrane protein n=1 Tax=Trema orientale TaxID=63057 RepID=A0A2P5EPL4_TREOI|nr:hypothetical protein TorRG33x02_166790 [Trema orientale]